MSEPVQFVFTITYHHRHGTDVSVFRSEAGAQRIAAQLAFDRFQEDMWSDEDRARFKALDDGDDVGALDLFQEIEDNLHDGETIEIKQTALGD